MKIIKQFIIGSLLIFSVSLLPSCGGAKTDTSETSKEDSTGLPGDNLSLQAALDLFKNSKSPEDFEKKLNATKKVNNLDLNGDSKTDYIRVKDEVSGTGHALVMQAVINDSEFQDVAVISIIKKQENSITLQIRGNEYMYGENAIVEPKPEEGRKEGEASLLADVFQTVSVEVAVDVSLWSPVAYIYEPTYVAWVSPVAWGVYPVWYEPWTPFPYNTYVVEIAPFKKNYIYTEVFYPNPAFQIYFTNRQNSLFVINRYDGFYIKNGWPKMKGKQIYGPGFGAKFHNPGHFGNHWDNGNHGYKNHSGKNGKGIFIQPNGGHIKMDKKGSPEKHYNHGSDKMPGHGHGNAPSMGGGGKGQKGGNGNEGKGKKGK